MGKFYCEKAKITLGKVTLPPPKNFFVTPLQMINSSDILFECVRDFIDLSLGPEFKTLN